MTRICLPPMSALGRVLRATAVALACCGLGLAQADIVTAPGGQPVPNCPLEGFSYFCVVDGQAQVIGITNGPYENVRISRTAGYLNGGSLNIGLDARLTLSPNLSNPDLVVGDNVGTAGTLSVVNGGQLVIDAPNPNFGGLLVGAFAAPADAPLQFGQPVASTRMFISDGGSVIVNKPAGSLVGSGIAIGRDLGSNSSVVLDGGIGNFGSPVFGATLSTTGNISMGREGKADVSLARNATMTAGITYMSVISAAGSSGLRVGIGSNVNGSVIAGIARDPNTGLGDPQGTGYGRADIFVQSGGAINGTVTMGRGATLRGSGFVAGVQNYGGVLTPGNSPGTLTIGSGGLFDDHGTLKIEFGNSGRDLLVVNGPVTLNGTAVAFNFIEGYAPTAGTSFEFLTSNSAAPVLTGLEYSITGLEPGFEFSVAPGEAGSLVFTAVNDGVAVVPEPGTFGMMAAALLGLAARRRLWATPA